MKKIIICCFSVLIIVISGCTPKENLLESELFFYTIYDEKATIMGLTEAGQSLETLIIPIEIDGYRVTGIGKEPSFMSTGGGSLSSKTIKRLYILGNIYIFRYALSLENIEYIFSNYYLHVSSLYTGYDSKYIDIFYPSYVKTDLDFLNRANVHYYFNLFEDSSEDLYLIDHYENQLIEFIPNNPKISNKTFLGWYKDKDGLIPWDFTNDIVVYNEEEPILNLYAKFSW